jgi:hypothetical protein
MTGKGRDMFATKGGEHGEQAAATIAELQCRLALTLTAKGRITGPAFDGSTGA